MARREMKGEDAPIGLSARFYSTEQFREKLSFPSRGKTSRPRQRLVQMSSKFAGNLQKSSGIFLQILSSFGQVVASGDLFCRVTERTTSRGIALSPKFSTSITLPRQAKTPHVLLFTSPIYVAFE